MQCYSYAHKYGWENGSALCGAIGCRKTFATWRLSAARYTGESQFSGRDGSGLESVEPRPMWYGTMRHQNEQ